jgi:hypothetical protein
LPTARTEPTQVDLRGTKPRCPTNRYRFCAQRAHHLRAARRDDRVRARLDRAKGRALHVVDRNGLGESKRRGDEEALRACANLAHVRASADHHLDARLVGRGGLFRRLGGDLRHALARPLERPQTGDGLAAFNVPAGEIEDAGHQPFSFFA